jgi:hypothetical protein
MKKQFFVTIAVALALMMSSCEKTSKIADADLNLADDDAVTETIFDDIFSSVDIASIALDGAIKGEFTKGSLLVADSCPVITVSHPDQTTWPKVITIDYGTGCTLNDVTRKGKIIVSITAPRHETGSMRSVTFDEYYFNGIKVEGTKAIENLGPNSNQNIVIAVTLTDGKITLPDGKTIEREVDREREWIAGINTPRYIWDDECLITGTTSGKNINDVLYTTTITVPLHWKRACRFIVEGVVMMEREGVEPVELDFGDGECDPKATLRRGDEEKEINLRVRHRLMP